MAEGSVILKNPGTHNPAKIAQIMNFYAFLWQGGKVIWKNSARKHYGLSYWGEVLDMAAATIESRF